MDLCADCMLPLSGGRANQVIESKVQWKLFWRATQLYPQNEWLGGNFPDTLMYAHGSHCRLIQTSHNLQTHTIVLCGECAGMCVLCVHECVFAKEKKKRKKKNIHTHARAPIHRSCAHAPHMREHQQLSKALATATNNENNNQRYQKYCACSYAHHGLAKNKGRFRSWYLTDMVTYW